MLAILQICMKTLSNILFPVQLRKVLGLTWKKCFRDLKNKKQLHFSVFWKQYIVVSLKMFVFLFQFNHLINVPVCLLLVFSAAQVTSVLFFSSVDCDLSVLRESDRCLQGQKCYQRREKGIFREKDTDAKTHEWKSAKNASWI